ncbi:MAG: GNAT family N-acetyltransferase [Pseudomonadota bacterium]
MTPVLMTERLLLRAHRRDDFPAMTALWSDPDVVRHIRPPSTTEECWHRLLRYRGLWDVLGFGYWAVEERETGAFLGDVGLADFARPGLGELEGAAEAGWVLSPTTRGRGIGDEAVGAMLAWADAQPGLPPIVAMIAPENGPSLRLAARHGFRFVRAANHGGPVHLFDRPGT